MHGTEMYDFPRIRGTFVRVPIPRAMVSWGLDWGSPKRNYHMRPPKVKVYECEEAKHGHVAVAKMCGEVLQNLPQQTA